MPPGRPRRRAEKREGAFYVWTQGELDASARRRCRRRAPGDSAWSRAAMRWPIRRGSSAARTFSTSRSRSRTSRRAPGRPCDAGHGGARRARGTRCSRRARPRPRPHLDDKVITAWNGLMIAAFAQAARLLVDSPRRDEWRAAAVRAATGCSEQLWRPAERRLLSPLSRRRVGHRRLLRGLRLSRVGPDRAVPGHRATARWLHVGAST